MPDIQITPKSSSIWRKLSPKCANRSCDRKTWLQAFGPRNPGLNVEGDWYCCAECFERTVRERIADLMNSQVAPAKPHTSRVPLGLLLLQRGILSAEQLKIALNLHRATESNFGEVVQQLGFATQEQVTAAVASQWACPVFPLGDRRLDVQVRVPRRFMELYRMLPVHYSESERRLLIGFVSSVQHQILYTIGHITSCTPIPCFITAREYELHLHVCPLGGRGRTRFRTNCRCCRAGAHHYELCCSAGGRSDPARNLPRVPLDSYLGERTGNGSVISGAQQLVVLDILAVS
jgi:hypothetical protein